jgi:hypothetical protein
MADRQDFEPIRCRWIADETPTGPQPADRALTKRIESGLFTDITA